MPQPSLFSSSVGTLCLHGHFPEHEPEHCGTGGEIQAFHFTSNVVSNGPLHFLYIITLSVQVSRHTLEAGGVAL